jgi:hypothetical protein
LEQSKWPAFYHAQTTPIRLGSSPPQISFFCPDPVASCKKPPDHPNLR